jgi:hypothetical protein
LRLGGGLRCLRFGSGGLLGVLLGLRCRLASLASLLFRALRLASRLLELLLRRAEFALELLHFALENAQLTLDRFDPVGRRVLCVGSGRCDCGTNRDQRATATTSRGGFVRHVPRSPVRTIRGKPINSMRHFFYVTTASRE